MTASHRPESRARTFSRDFGAIIVGAVLLVAFGIYQGFRADNEEQAKNVTGAYAQRMASPVVSACIADAKVRERLGEACPQATAVLASPVASVAGGRDEGDDPPRKVVLIPSPGPTVTMTGRVVTVTQPPKPAVTVTAPGETVVQSVTETTTAPGETVVVTTTTTETKTTTAAESTTTATTTTTATRTATATTTQTSTETETTTCRPLVGCTP